MWHAEEWAARTAHKILVLKPEDILVTGGGIFKTDLMIQDIRVRSGLMQLGIGAIGGLSWTFRFRVL
jgi:hypothetical protein